MVLALALGGALACGSPDESLGAGGMIEETTSSSIDATAGGSPDPSATSTSGPAPTTTSVGPDGDDATTNPPPSEEGGNAFTFPPPDGGALTFECDLFAQDCPKGEKCTPWDNGGGYGSPSRISSAEGSWNATRCVPVSEDAAHVGDPCQVEGTPVSGIDDCGVGLMCWNVGADGQGTCEDMCIGSADNPQCEADGDLCAITNDGAIVLCLPACDPLAPNCSRRGDACMAVNDDWACVPDASGPSGALGDECEFINGCDAGLMCLSVGTLAGCTGPVSCCTSICDLGAAGADESCAAEHPEHICDAWYIAGPGPDGLEDVGVCRVPF